MLRNGLDETRGTIIGGDYFVGRLYYGDRPQSGKLYAETEADLIAQARKRKCNLIAENNISGLTIYPDDSLWQLRIYS